MFSTEDLKTAIGATVIARRNAAARLREAGNPRDPFRALPGMEQQFFEAAQSVRSYDLVLNLLEREVKREARKRAGRTAQSAAVFLITAGLIILATLGFAAALLLMLGESAALHPDELVYGLLANGFTEKCYDGKTFFATDHPVGKDKASNKGTAKLSMDAYKTARTSMMSLKNSKGRPLALVPDLLVVPPALEADARDILVADFINGTKNTMQGTAEIHVEPRLASDSAWFLLCTKRPVKPLIYQQRKKAKFVSKTNETDDNVFMSKKFIYGADSRGNAGFGFWQMAYGSDGTTT